MDLIEILTNPLYSTPTAVILFVIAYEFFKLSNKIRESKGLPAEKKFIDAKWLIERHPRLWKWSMVILRITMLVYSLGIILYDWKTEFYYKGLAWFVIIINLLRLGLFFKVYFSKYIR